MEGFATVEEALEELRNGKLILVTDDEDRENEGDFICAAEFSTICGKCSFFTYSADIGIQISPFPCIAIKLMFSVVANSAALLKLDQ